MDQGKAATRIQASYRGRSGRKRVQKMQIKPPRDVPMPASGVSKPPLTKDQAATKIQAAFRGKRARSQLERAPRPPAGIRPPAASPPAPAAATTVVSATRQKLPPGVKPPKQAPKPGVRRGLPTAALPPSGVSPPAEVVEMHRKAEEEENRAATKIQATFRGRMARRISLEQRKALIEAEREKRAMAAAKIQARFRGNATRKSLGIKPRPSLSRNVRPASREAPRGNAPPNIRKGATQLQQQLQESERKRKAAEAEVKQLRYLIGSKDQAISSVRMQLQDKVDEIEMKETDIKLREQKIKSLEEEIADLQGQLEDEGKDFDAMGTAMEEQDKLVKKKNQQIVFLQDKVRFWEKESDRLKVVIRRQEKQIESLMPEKCDAALSARSYSERDAVSYRDEVIASKETQLRMQNDQITKLLANVDQVEQEVERLQSDYISKETMCNKQKGEIGKLEAKMKRMEKEMAELQGRDAAMEISSKQNSSLLQLLQQQEAHSTELEEQLASIKDDRGAVQQKVVDLMKANAEMEVRLMHAERESSRNAKRLATSELEKEGLRKQLGSELFEVKRASRVKVDAVHEELRMRREKQYLLLDRLHAAEEAMRRTQDEEEELRETCRILQERVFELDARLLEAKQWRQQEQDGLDEARRNEMTKVDAARREAKKERLAKEALKLQLEEMAATVLKLIEQQKEGASAVVDAERKLENKDGEVEALKMRIAALLEESTMQGRKRLVAETKNKTMSKQLDALKDEASSLISNERSLTEHLAEREHELRTRINDLSERLREEKTNRLRGLKMHLDERRAANAIAIAWQAKSEEETKVIELNAAVSAVDIDQMRIGFLRDGLEAVTGLIKEVIAAYPFDSKYVDLAGYGIECSPEETDLLMPFLFESAAVGEAWTGSKVKEQVQDGQSGQQQQELLQQPPLRKKSAKQLVHEVECVDLSENRIGDSGVIALAQALVSYGKARCLKKLDLRNNRISAEGIRHLAEALDGNELIGVSRVYVHQDGRIEALGGGKLPSSSEAEAEDGERADSSSGLELLLEIDARGNVSSRAFGAAKTELEKTAMFRKARARLVQTRKRQRKRRDAERDHRKAMRDERLERVYAPHVAEESAAGVTARSERRSKRARNLAGAIPLSKTIDLGSEHIGGETKGKGKGRGGKRKKNRARGSDLDTKLSSSATVLPSV